MNLPNLCEAIGLGLHARTRPVMTVWWCLALSLMAASAACAQEGTLYSKGRAQFRDGLYDMAEKQFRQLVEQFPSSPRREEVVLLWAQSLLKLGRWEEAAQVLQAELDSAKPPKRQEDGYLFWLAEAQSKGRQHGQAEKRYRELLEKHPQSAYQPQAEYGLGWSLYQSSRWEEALERFGRLATSRAGGRAGQELARNARLAMGQVHLARQEYEKAEEVFRALAEQTPADKHVFEARYWLGQTAYAQKRYAEALTALESLVAQPRTVPTWLMGESWWLIGWTYWNVGNYEKSAEAFEQAFRLLENDYRKRESAVQYGQCYLRLGKIETAIEKWREFVRAHPDDPLAADVQLAIADIYLSQTNGGGAAATARLEEAAREYRRLLQNHPQSGAVPAAHYGLGWALYELKKYEEAASAFQLAAEQTRDAVLGGNALYKMGDALFVARQYDKAAAAYQTLVEKYPGHPQIEAALFQIFQAQLNLKNLAAAQATLTRLLDQFPQTPYRDEAWMQLGLAYLNQQLYNAARTVYQDFLRKHADSPLAGRVMLALGQTYYLEGAYAEALEQFDRLAREGNVPADLLPMALYFRARCLYQMGETDKALREFTALVENHRQAAIAPEAQFRIGELHYNQRNYTEAQRQFALLQKNYPASLYADAALYWAGRAAFQRQGFKEAVEFFEGLIKTYPQSRWRCDARFWQADAYAEQGGEEGFANALVLFEELIRDFRDCDLVDEAWGRKGDCQFTLKRYKEAIFSYQNVIASATADVAQKNQALYQVGLCHEKLAAEGAANAPELLENALKYYTDVLYSRLPESETKPVESFWFCRAGLSAASLLKRQQRLAEAAKVYQRLADANVTCSVEAREQLRLLGEDKAALTLRP